MLPDSLATQRSELLAELRSKLVEYSGDRILVVLAPATASDLKVASAPYPHAGAFLGWIQHPELGWCGATAFIAYEEEEYCVFEFRKLLRRAGGLLPTLETPVNDDGVRQSEPDAARWVSALTANVGKAQMEHVYPEDVSKLAPNAMALKAEDYYEFSLEDLPISTWLLKKTWSKSIELAESLGWSEPRAESEFATDELEQLVRLDQMAATVNRSKKTLERLKQTGKLPQPDVEGGGGKPDEWNWSSVKPILEQQFGRKLPDRFPSLRK